MNSVRETIRAILRRQSVRVVRKTRNAGGHEVFTSETLSKEQKDLVLNGLSYLHQEYTASARDCERFGSGDPRYWNILSEAVADLRQQIIGRQLAFVFEPLASRSAPPKKGGQS